MTCQSGSKNCARACPLDPEDAELATKPSHNDWSRVTSTLTVSMMPCTLSAVSVAVSSMTTLHHRVVGAGEALEVGAVLLKDSLHARNLKLLHRLAFFDQLDVVGNHLLNGHHPLVIEHRLSLNLVHSSSGLGKGHSFSDCWRRC